MKGKVLIEVGCGRGGCFRYIVNEYQPKRAVGVDLSQQNVNFCRQTFAEKPVETQTEVAFIEANSMTIHQNFQAKSADIILNVESSHCYPSLEEFFKAVCVVLKDDGIFLYADFRYSG